MSKNFTFDKNKNLTYSLHDSRVKEIKFHNKTLTLKVDSIFEYINGEEKIYLKSRKRRNQRTLIRI